MKQVICFVLLLVGFLGFFPMVAESQESLRYKLEILSAFIETIERNHVDGPSINVLLEGAIEGILSRLDPHTNYLPADNFKRLSRRFEGFSGIGIYYRIVDSYPVVMAVEKGSSAERLFMPGDVIITINGISTKGESERGLSMLVRESSTSSISFVCMRGDKKVSLSAHRVHVDIPTIDNVHLFKGKVGYLACNKFNGNTTSELDKALALLESLGMESLIIDLRDNGGGYLSAAIEVADRFLSPGKLITYTKGKYEHSYQEYYASFKSKYETLPLVVLVNHGTASASEILSGTLQDWDRAIIVGETTFGKGLVQSQFRFRDDSALLVTTARYYTPLGRLIQRDYTNLTKDNYYYGAYQVRSNQRNGKLFQTQLGRMLYENNGIVPDVVVVNAKRLSQMVAALYISENNYFLKTALKYFREFKKRRPEKISVGTREFEYFCGIVLDKNSQIDRRILANDYSDIKFLLDLEIAELAAGAKGRFVVSKERDIQLKTAIASVPKSKILIRTLAERSSK